MMRRARPGTPLRGRYYVQNPLLRVALGCIDLALGGLPRGRPAGPARAEAPQRLLLAIGGHLGDVVLGSSVLPAIRAAWPTVEIGVLVGSWARPVIADHPDVRRVHVMDHWKLNRSGKSRAHRLRRHISTGRRALAEIREIGYDLAIDLHPFFPNAIPLLWRAGIPSRIGYTSAGFGPLLTHPLPWRDAERHRMEYHADLLREAGIGIRSGAGLHYSLPRATAGDATGPTPPGDYLVIHMGAGLPLKEWPRERWERLTEELLAAGHTLVFTGSGEDQAREAESLARGRASCYNLCSRLDWSGYVRAVADARLMVCVDSVAGHVAAAVGTPVVVLMSGTSRPRQWVPRGEQVRMLTNVVPCAPCFRSRGCREMTCVRGIPVEQVLASIRECLPPPERQQEIGARA
jgi:ADP-heptose:LPS heptosyltransferase